MVVYLITFNYLTNVQHPVVSLDHLDITAISLRFKKRFAWQRLPTAEVNTSKIFYFLELIITLFLINAS